MSKEDKVIYNTLVNLQEYCNKHSECKDCDLQDREKGVCALAVLVRELACAPYLYNLDEIRRLLEYDI